MTDNLSVFDIALFDSTNPNLSHYTCGICYNIPKTPRIYSCCEKLTCRNCMIKSLEIANKCPFCKTRVSESQVKESKFCKTIINEFEKFCINKEKGCVEKAKLTKILFHELSECDYRLEECEYCDEEFEQIKLNDHKLVCDFRPKPCELCGKLQNYYHMKQHLEETCKEKEIECPKYCNTIIKRGNLETHYETCSKVQIQCELCTELIFREDWHLHLTELCDYIEIQCPHCQLIMIKGELNTHLSNECEKVILPCEYNCGINLKREEKIAHNEVCSTIPVKCSICFLMIPKNTIETHEGDLKLHLRQLNKQIKKNKLLSQVLNLSTLEWPPINSKILPYLKNMEYYVSTHDHILRVCDDVFELNSNNKNNKNITTTTINICGCCDKILRKSLEKKNSYITYGDSCTKFQ